MTNTTTIRLSEALLKLQALYPQWRYGQLVSNVAAWAGESGPTDLWEVDDEQLLRAALEHLAKKASTGADRRVG